MFLFRIDIQFYIDIPYMWCVDVLKNVFKKCSLNYLVFIMNKKNEC